MATRRVRFGMVVFFVAICPICAAGFAQNSDPASAESALIQRLLNEGWERSPKARTDAQTWFESAPANVRANPTVQWAYALNRMQHRKFREAKPFVDQLAPLRPKDWDLAYTQIWLAVFVRDYEPAMLLMRQLTTNVGAAADLTQEQKTEVFFRLGRLIGFLQGPAGGQVNGQSLENTAAAILQGAGAEETKEFSAQRAVVSDQFASLMSARDQKQQKELDNQVRRQQVELEQQTALVGQMEQQSNDARSKRELVINEGQAAVDQSKAQVDSLTGDLNRQQHLISATRFDLDALWFSIAQIDDALAVETDPAIRQRLLLDRSLFAIRARDKEIELNLQRANANSLYDQLGTASANYDQAVSNLQGRVQAIDQQISSAEQTLARANRKIRGLQGDPKVSNAVVGTIDATARALTNYDPFPADLLKQRLLRTLAANAK